MSKLIEDSLRLRFEDQVQRKGLAFQMEIPNSPQWRSATKTAFFLLMQVAASRSRRFGKDDNVDAAGH